MKNERYADLLEQIADLLQVTGANPFKVRAFQKAARVINAYPDAIDDRIEAGDVTSIDGIGKSIAADLAQMHARGSCDALDQLRAELPDGITDLLKIQGLGPKKLRKIYEQLGIGDLDTLELAAQEGRLAALDGFGRKTEEKLLKEIDRLRRSAGRTPIAVAWPLAEEIVQRLRALPEVERAEVAG
ncbi:MAG: hypothetical protein GY873_26085, partial [Bosea sp.]|uniref:helix-hairpin-helix domain-containing protein n=1 Tax=Bosea sp. (in: a-proteobacteria) TaxID=1871050 RepID=UPI0023A1E36E|nr:hypothetical protein [Bosea sp. (in: a-proteobacteria)]